jgi:hypothetical protein
MIYSMFKKLKHFFVHNKATRNLIFVILFVELIFVFPKALNLIVRDIMVQYYQLF